MYEGQQIFTMRQEELLECAINTTTIFWVETKDVGGQSEVSGRKVPGVAGA